MYPILFATNGRVVYSYSVVLISSVAAALLWLAYTGRRSHDRRFDAGLAALAVGVLGARLTHVLANWEYFSERGWTGILLPKAGLSWHGGLLAGLAGLALWAWRTRQQDESTMSALHAMLAALAPALLLGIAGGWLGCLLGGCAYGRALPPPQRFYTVDWPDLYGVHAFRLPSQLFGLLLVAALLATLRLWQRRPGLMLVAYGMGDFLIACTRGDLAVTWERLWPVQWADLTIIVVGVAIDRLGRRAPPVSADSASA